MTLTAFYPIGTPGTPWGSAEIAAWLARQTRHRSYQQDVLNVVDALRSRYDVVEYGRLDYSPEMFPLVAIKTRAWRNDLPCMLVTGGVHGYETSGVHGALRFAQQQASA